MPLIRAGAQIVPDGRLGGGAVRARHGAAQHQIAVLLEMAQLGGGQHVLMGLAAWAGRGRVRAAIQSV